MRSKCKKWTTVTVALLAVGVWVPQLLPAVVERDDAPRPEVANLPAGAPALDSGGGGPSVEEALPSPSGGEGLAAPLAIARAEDPVATGSLGDALHGTAQEVEALVSSHGRVDLDRLLRSYHDSLAAASRVDGGELPEEPSGRALPASPSPDREEAVAASALAEFAAANPLGAVIDDGESPLAMLGSRLVRVGDELPGGITVAAIARRSAELCGSGHRLRLELPPFVARESRRGEGSAPAGEAEEEPAPEEARDEAPTTEGAASGEPAAGGSPSANPVDEEKEVHQR